jgi:hypothetical protein
MTASENRPFVRDLRHYAAKIVAKRNKVERIIARIVLQYLDDCEDELALKLELTKLRAGSAWNKLKEETFINEFWTEVENKLTKGE